MCAIMISSIGLLIDFIGAIMIWKFVPSLFEENEHGDITPSSPFDDEKKNKYSKLGMLLIAIGFIFQLIGNIIQLYK